MKVTPINDRANKSLNADRLALRWVIMGKEE